MRAVSGFSLGSVAPLLTAVDVFCVYICGSYKVLEVADVFIVLCEDQLYIFRIAG